MTDTGLFLILKIILILATLPFQIWPDWAKRRLCSTTELRETEFLHCIPSALLNSRIFFIYHVYVFFTRFTFTWLCKPLLLRKEKSYKTHLPWHCCALLQHVNLWTRASWPWSAPLVAHLLGPSSLWQMPCISLTSSFSVQQLGPQEVAVASPGATEMMTILFQFVHLSTWMKSS